MSIVSKLLPLSTQAKKSVCLLPSALQSVIFRYDRQYSSSKESGLSRTRPSGERSDISTDVRPLGEKVKEATKTASYTGVILVGIGVTGIIFYYVFRELFSSNSPNSIYSEALEKCKNVSYLTF